MKPTRDTSTPWYRVPLVWLAIALPLTAVIAGAVTLWLAIASDDGLVADDYYRRGKEINRDLSRDRAAAARGLKAMLRWQPPGELRIRFNLEAAALPAQIELQFLHSTRAGLDQKILLTRAPDGSFRTLLPALADGRWHVQLAADDWRLSGTLSVPGDHFVAFVPAP